MRDNVPPGQEEAQEAAARMAYAHRPKPFSSELELTLLQDTLRAEQGRSNQNVPLKAIRRIDLAFTPKNAAQRAFTCTLGISDGRTVKFHNISWKSLVEVQRLDAGYSRFVRALVREVADANPDVALHAGVSPWRYTLMIVTGCAIVLGVVGAAIYAMARQGTLVGLVSLGLGAYLAYWLRDYLARNRPRVFTPAAIPPEILPDA